MPILTTQPIILASKSSIRKQLLESAGIEFSVIPSSFDESAHRDSIADLHPTEQAMFLAEQKALVVSRDNPNALVIGSDQVCYLEHTKQILNKPKTVENAILQLQLMNGKNHSQNCACVIAKNNKIIWQTIETADIKLRQLTECDIKSYVALDEPFEACGSYKFESYGKHLFTSVVGNYDVIMGLPMLALINQFYSLNALSMTGANK